MQKFARAIYPDGRQDVREVREDTDTYALYRELVGGRLEYVAAHYHALSEHEVIIDEEGLVSGLAPNWIGSRLIGLDLTTYPPFRGPIVIVPHDPEDGPTPAQQRNQGVSPDGLLNLYSRALEGDPAALSELGVRSADDIMIFDARPEVLEILYLIHPDGRMERQAIDGADEGRAWVESKLGGEAYRVPPEHVRVSAYAVIYGAHPSDHRANAAASRALGLPFTIHGPVVLAPTGRADPSPFHQRLDEALCGDEAARAQLGLTAHW